MVYSISYKSESSYLSKNKSSEQLSVGTYKPIDVYRRDMQSDKKMTFGSFLRRCLCCNGSSDDDPDSRVDNPSSALVGPTGRSYTLNHDTIRPSVALQESSIPALIITKPIDDEYSASTTTLLLSSERNASTVSLNLQNSCFKKVESSPCESSQDSDSNGQRSSLKSGEKIPFIREILSCRDSFLKSLEWCDNTLTRGKRCRLVRPDEWLALKNEGTDITYEYRHALSSTTNVSSLTMHLRFVVISILNR